MRDQDGAPLADTTQDYRLPKNVTPKRYDIRLTPDLKAFTFQGEVNIAVVVNEAADDVVLNALELEIDKVTAERGGKSVVAKAELEASKERAHLRFAEKLAPGEWTLKIAFPRNPERQAARLLSQSVSGRGRQDSRRGDDAVRIDRRAPRVSVLGRAGAQGQLQSDAGGR